MKTVKVYHNSSGYKIKDSTTKERPLVTISVNENDPVYIFCYNDIEIPFQDLDALKDRATQEIRRYSVSIVVFKPSEGVFKESARMYINRTGADCISFTDDIDSNILGIYEFIRSKKGCDSDEM